MLLALDRIEHDDELTYEVCPLPWYPNLFLPLPTLHWDIFWTKWQQLLVLETNLLLSDLGLHDQHQDMRMDIDNMSYEVLLSTSWLHYLCEFNILWKSLNVRFVFGFVSQELLALEEHIGSVSTALTEEQFAKYVNQSMYEARNSDRNMNKITVDDVKCSICQVLIC